jgi:general secretion pathway protein C
MVTNSQNMWWSRGITLMVWGLASASAVWWGLRIAGLSQPVHGVPPPVAAPGEMVVDSNAVARMLGAVAAAQAAPPPAAASRFALLGVVASRSSQGAALIAVDGKPGRPYRVGSKIEDGLILQAVDARHARLGPASGSGVSLTLEMPPLKK